MKMAGVVRCIFILWFLVSGVLWGAGADEEKKKTITVAPGKQYKAGGLHRLFFGSHWRNLWTTPIEVEVLDLERFAGGLTPHKRGGGMQTKSLRLKGKDGNTWKFRSVNKDPEKILPKVFRDTIAKTVLQDQISSSNPMAALVLSPILNAVGILQAEARLVWMPDDEGLGEFREEFGGMLGTIEIHPQGRDGDSPGFEGAKKIIGTFELFKRLEKERDEYVDTHDFLRARLVDIFVGDWDRHTDQWRWAVHKEGKRKIWRPIPRDRDQAFARFYGIFPRLGEYAILQLAGFRRRYPRVKKLTWSGRYLDRRFLTELDKPTWDAITKDVRDKLTDRVIEEAVKRLPPEHFKIAGKGLMAKLKARRDRLPLISGKYYRRINRVIDVFTGDKDDLVEINRVDENKTTVTVFKKSKKKGEKKGKPLYFKIVDNRLTSEIRINMGGGDDRAEVRGVVRSGPTVRVEGGKGKDEFIDESMVKGFFLYITPFRDAETKTVFYDGGKKTVFKKGPGTKVVREKLPKPKTDLEKYEPLQRNRGSEIYGAPVFSFNSDDGVVYGGTVLFYKFGFRVKPYKYWFSLNASYATKTKSHHFHFNGIFQSIIKGAAVHLEVLKTQLLFNDYFGYGNETPFDSELEKEKYYRIEEEFFIVRPSVRFDLFKNMKASMGLGYAYSEIGVEHGELLNGVDHPGYGLGGFNSFELTSSLQYDTRDKPANAHRGVFLKLDGSYAPRWLDNKYEFIRSGFDARVYFPMHVLTGMTLALRLGGTKVWGDYPFFRAVFLGGGGDLRGYSRKRFSGDSALFGQAELRTNLGRVKFILPGRLGFHVFSDVGRVFKSGEDSEMWHSGYGGGIWIAFADRMLNTSITLAKSTEKLSIYFALKLMF